MRYDGITYRLKPRLAYGRQPETVRLASSGQRGKL